MLEGLVLDHNGYLRMTADDIRLAVGIGRRLPGDRKEVVFDELADRADDALLSYAFDEERQEAAIARLWELMGEQDSPAVGEALTRIAWRIEELREAQAWDEDEDA